MITALQKKVVIEQILAVDSKWIPDIDKSSRQPEKAERLQFTTEVKRRQVAFDIHTVL